MSEEKKDDGQKEAPRRLHDEDPNEDIQHGRQAQNKNVNPDTNIQKGHRDREQI